MSERLKEKLEAGQYYDYEQLVKTLFFKYKLRKRDQEMRALIKQAMVELNEHKQKDLVVDILEIYYVEHVKKIGQSAADDFFIEIVKYAITNGEVIRAQGVIERIIDFTKNSKYEIAELLAVSFKEQGLFSKAYKYFFKSRNETEVIYCMEKVMASGYESEQDLFIARACIEMIQRSPDITKARAIRENFREVKDADGGDSPILNFVDFLIEAIELGEFEMVKQMANNDYKAALKRDSSLYEKVNQICMKKFDGKTIKAENPMMAMMSQMMGGMGGGAR